MAKIATYVDLIKQFGLNSGVSSWQLVTWKPLVDMGGSLLLNEHTLEEYKNNVCIPITDVSLSGIKDQGQIYNTCNDFSDGSGTCGNKTLTLNTPGKECVLYLGKNKQCSVRFDYFFSGLGFSMGRPLNSKIYTADDMTSKSSIGIRYYPCTEQGSQIGATSSFTLGSPSKTATVKITAGSTGYVKFLLPAGHQTTILFCHTDMISIMSGVNITVK